MTEFKLKATSYEKPFHNVLPTEVHFGNSSSDSVLPSPPLEMRESESKTFNQAACNGDFTREFAKNSENSF